MLVSSDVSTDAGMALASKDYLRARDLYRQAYVDTPAGGDTSVPMLGMAMADYGLKNYYEAAVNFKRFVKLYSNSPQVEEAYLLWGISCLRIKKYKDAEEHLDMVRGNLRQEADIAMAELEFLKGNTPGAEKRLEKLDRKFYDSQYRAIYLRAMILSSKGKHDEAVNMIDRIPGHVVRAEDISVNRAIIYYNANRYKRAKELLTRIIRDPATRVENIQAKRTLFKISAMENDDDKTLALGLDLIDYGVGDDVRMKVVSIYDKKSDMENAFRILVGMRDKKLLGSEVEKRLRAAAAKSDPRYDEFLGRYWYYLDPDSRYNIEAAKYEDEKGRKDIARRILYRALKGRHGSEAAMILGEQYIAEKRYREAKKIILPATTDFNFSGRACMLMERILAALGDAEGAADFRRRAIRILLAEKDYFSVAELNMVDGNRPEALKYYTKAADKGNVTAMIKAADLYYVGGKTGISKEYYKKAIDKGIKDQKSLQWASYQYGKISEDEDYLEKARSGGGAVAETAGMLKSLR
jgi:tetratricopeptide (TPR) repeat protein